MTGKSHVVVSICTELSTAAILFSYKILNAAEVVPSIKVVDLIYDFIFRSPLWIILGCTLFLLGGILPDIDIKGSLVSKIFFGLYLPVEHRTWTHTIWAVCIFLLLSIRLPSIRFLAAGYALHLVLDSFSTSGVCWFYPIENYRYYKNGAKVKKGKHIKLYKTNQPAEYIIMGIIICLTIVICVTPVLLQLRIIEAF